MFYSSTYTVSRPSLSVHNYPKTLIFHLSFMLNIIKWFLNTDFVWSLLANFSVGHKQLLPVMKKWEHVLQEKSSNQI